MDDFDILVQKYPTSAEAWTLHGEAKRLLGDLDGAMADFDESLDRDAGNMGARFGRARVYCDQNRPRLALGELDPVIERHPDWPAPRWLRATLRLFRGDAERAVADLRCLHLHAGAVPLQTQMLEAQALINCNRPAEALAVCEKIIHDAPDFWYAWIWHGQAHVALGGPDSGKESFDRAVEMLPEQASFVAAQQGLAALTYHHRREDFDVAICLATEPLEQFGDGFPTWHLRANAYWYSQQLVEAAEEFSTILRDCPEMSFARSGRGQVLAELGDADAALLDLNPAIEEFENSVSDEQLAYALSGRALAWITLERWDEAENDLDRSLLLAPSNAWSMYHRGTPLVTDPRCAKWVGFRGSSRAAGNSAWVQCRTEMARDFP